MQEFAVSVGLDIFPRLEGSLFVAIQHRIERAVSVEFVSLVLGPDYFLLVDALPMLVSRWFIFRVIVLENILTRVAFFPLALRPEAAAIKLHLGQFGSGDVGNSWQHIREIHQVIAHNADRHCAWAVDDQGRMGSAIGGKGLLSFALLRAIGISQRAVSAVICGVNNHGLLAQTVFL